jgi:hypothetical protein
MSLWNTLTYRGLDFEGDVDKHPTYLEEAFNAGKRLTEELRAEI